MEFVCVCVCGGGRRARIYVQYVRTWYHRPKYLVVFSFGTVGRALPSLFESDIPSPRISEAANKPAMANRTLIFVNSAKYILCAVITRNL